MRAKFMKNQPPCVLVTGFEAFGDDPSGLGLNPSALAAQALQGVQIAGYTVVAAVLPCVFGRSTAVLKALVRQHRPALVLCVGQASGRAGISIERLAVNWDDAPLPDNAGCVLQAVPVVARGPVAYFSTLPLYDMQAALHNAGMACELSSSAGHFVCNHVFYGLMHSLKTARRKNTSGLEQAPVQGGFIHVPYLPEQATPSGAPSMSLQHITQGLRIALHAAIVQLPNLDAIDTIAA